MALPADLPGIRLSALIYRVVRAGLDPLGTAGSLKAGGRYNPPLEFGVLYTSLDALTAVAEVERGLRLRGIEPTQFPVGAWWIYEMEVKLESVLDLTDSNVLEKLGAGRDSLLGPEVRAAREFAAEARRAEYQALLAPSVANPGSKNLVIFLDKLPEPPIMLTSKPVNFRAEKP